MSLERAAPRLRPAVVIAMMLAGLALQTTLLNALGDVKPDLVLVTALCAGLLAGPGVGAAYGAAAGLIAGFAQGMVLGAFGVSRTLGAGLAGMVETRIQRDRVVVPALTVLIGSLATHALFFVMAPQLPLSRPIRIAVTESLLDMLFALPIYLVLLRWGLRRVER